MQLRLNCSLSKLLSLENEICKIVLSSLKVWEAWLITVCVLPYSPEEVAKKCLLCPRAVGMS